MTIPRKNTNLILINLLEFESDCDDDSDALESHAILEKIKKIVKYVRGSPQRRKSFKEFAQIIFQDDSNDGNLVLILDVETRWNSTYHMLERALKLRKVIEMMAMSDKIF